MDRNQREGLLEPNIRKVIVGRNVVLKPMDREHINDTYLSWLNDEKINRYLEVRYKKQTTEEVVRYVNQLRKIRGCDLFSITTKSGGVFVGTAAITKFNPNGQQFADFGVMICNERAQAMGIGGEVNLLLLEFLWGFPELIRINGGVVKTNETAWRTMESVGFTREGTKRKGYVAPEGQSFDVFNYGMLREDWLVSRQKFMSIIGCIMLEAL